MTNTNLLPGGPQGSLEKAVRRAALEKAVRRAAQVNRAEALRRRRLHADPFAREYRSGDAIRAIAERHRMSYGYVRKVLIEAGVQMRSRGWRSSSQEVAE